ncbi:hypothetical protein C0995_010695 [Termitomyces sp. Mi166|nr:hypothetical protein C0995_010695 [Termitomyces sp. Mi166\
MALQTTANLATIGSFTVDILSFGFLTINKHENIRDPLAEGNALLDGAIDTIGNFSVYLNDKEFENAMQTCEKARQMVAEASQHRSSFENFIVRAKKYSQNKIQANEVKIKCQTWLEQLVQVVSLRAKRRMDLGQQIIDQHDMKKRLGRLADAGFKLAETASNNLVMSLKGNELDSPFRDPEENPWKTATVSGLQSSASK